MKVAGWKISRLSTTTQSSSSGTQTGNRAHHALPQVTTLGELRERG